MANKIGKFEILSELDRSELCAVYKATDPDSGQTVALKTVKLEALPDQSPAATKTFLEESEAAKQLNSPNIAALLSVEEIDGQLCAAAEYVQGNSVGTALDRHDGFSIWDIQDITRQVAQAFDHAAQHQIVHLSLEPSKIMSGWDGTVKILGFGISSMGTRALNAAGKPADILYYASPEQVNNAAMDARSNLFSLGAILYEMATEQKAFPGEDADEVRRNIREHMPSAPIEMNKKVHPALSELIMKALAKDPAQRYQSGRELVIDIERCKESPAKAAEVKKDAKRIDPPRGITGVTPQKAQESVSAAAPTPAPPPATPAAFAAAAGISSNSTKSAATEAPAEGSAMGPGPMSMQAAGSGMKLASALIKADVEPLPTIEPPAIKVDPAMAEASAASAPKKSFSDVGELPPLKPVFIAPPAPVEIETAPETEAASAAHAAVFKKGSAEKEKPGIQAREIAKKAASEIKKTPPKLFMYAIAGAIGVVLLIIVAIAFHIHSANSDDGGSPVQSAAPTKPATPALAQPAAQAAQQPAAQTAAAPTPQQVQPEAIAPEPQVSVTPKLKPGRKAKAAPAAVASAVAIPGQLTINSTPEGAQLQIDGRSDAAWSTPYNVAGLAPGSHTVVVSKPGYSAETRTIDVASASKSFLTVQLAAVTASVSIGSDPAGAAILMDGKDTGKVTPAQISVDKLGAHTFMVRKQGYLDESTNATLQAAQVFHFAPALRPLGSADNIKIGGKFKKMFGGADKTAMGAVEIKTQPKGAQIAVNNRVLDKNSPVEFQLDPGNYVIDVTLSGYQSIHRVITIDKGGKAVIDEVMQREQ